MSALSISQLTKTYRDAKTETLHGITMDVSRGQFFGLLGPNGAGKTTTIHCITGISSPSGGSITVCGYDVVRDYRAARACIGLSPQEFNIDIFQTVDEILDYQAGFFGIAGERMRERREELLNRFGLLPHRSKRFQVLSGGLKRRATLAKAMMHDPAILILDEPTAGVDVETRHELWRILRDMRESGKTIILTSHYLEEVESLCDRVAIIKDGSIILDDMVKTLTETHKLEDVYLRVVGMHTT